MAVEAPACPVCSGIPTVAVIVGHEALRRLIVELLQRDQACWQIRSGTSLSAVGEPDLLVLDAKDLEPAPSAAHTVARPRTIVIGQEPDGAYERYALQHGADAWLSRDEVGEKLTPCARRLLGCTGSHRTSPPRPRLSPTNGRSDDDRNPRRRRADHPGCR